MLELNKLYLMDCMDGMALIPDKYFELAIVDPPYGGSADRNELKTLQKVARTGGTWASKYNQNIKTWDIAPSDEYFSELFRVSKNQIIWGGNYFNLPPTRCFCVWRKLTISESFTMAMCEYAWTSFNDNAKWLELAPQDKTRFHPAQKPVKLYRWLLSLYAKPGDKILDTHVGSASSLIACYELGYDFLGFEIDPDYYALATERLNKAMAQVLLFPSIAEAEA